LGALFRQPPPSLLHALPARASKAAAVGGVKPLDGEALMVLINAYGAALEAHAASESAVSDISKLPAPKDTMRSAFLAAISVTEDKVLREQLRGAYVRLADFQPGVGAQVIKIDAGLSTSSDIREVAARVAAQGKVFSEWVGRVKPEAERLLKDLADAGF
jgi:hypothetical protein